VQRFVNNYWYKNVDGPKDEQAASSAVNPAHRFVNNYWYKNVDGPKDEQAASSAVNPEHRFVNNYWYKNVDGPKDEQAASSAVNPAHRFVNNYWYKNVDAPKDEQAATFATNLAHRFLNNYWYKNVDAPNDKQRQASASNPQQHFVNSYWYKNVDTADDEQRAASATNPERRFVNNYWYKNVDAPNDEQREAFASNPLQRFINSYWYKNVDTADDEQRAASTANPERRFVNNYWYKNADLQLKEESEHIDRQSEHVHHESEHVHDFMLPSYFLKSDLVKGSIIDLGVNFVHDTANPKRDFLPETVADTLPALKASNLPKLLQAFNISEGTETATDVERAIFYCEGIANLPAEEKDASCPTSEKAMAEFVSSQLGENAKLFHTTVVPAKALTVGANLTIVEYNTRSADTEDNAVVCHNLPFPSQVYYCHKVSKTQVSQAILEAAEGLRINAVTLCHLDTSWWSVNHLAFKTLNVPRGTEVCHWAFVSTLIWVPRSNI
jgi:hypothetical protein